MGLTGELVTVMASKDYGTPPQGQMVLLLSVVVYHHSLLGRLLIVAVFEVERLLFLFWVLIVLLG